MTTADRDPRPLQHGAQWRDALRRQLNFARLGIDFAEIVIKPLGSTEDLVVFSSNDPDRTLGWTAAVAAIGQ